jgi:hypothetical protein
MATHLSILQVTLPSSIANQFFRNAISVSLPPPPPGNKQLLAYQRTATALNHPDLTRTGPKGAHGELTDGTIG